MQLANYPFVNFSFQSLCDWQNRELAEMVIHRIINANLDYTPQVYSRFEPVKEKIDKENVEPITSLWLNEEINRNLPSFAPPVRAGHLMLRRKKNPEVEYMLSWEKNNRVGFNSMNLSVEVNHLQDIEKQQSFFDLCWTVARILQPVRGHVINQSIPYIPEPLAPQIIHPELHWINLFGRPYIELFGREKLLSAPCYKVEELAEGIIALQLTDNLFEPIPEEMRASVKKYLCEQAFVESGKTYRDYLNKDIIVPNFDYSQVMFDRTQPIIFV
jgi:hypothetical protein